MALRRELENLLHVRLKEKNPLVQVLLGPRQVGKSTAAHSLFSQWPDDRRLMVTADAPQSHPPEWIAAHWQQSRLKGPGTLLIIDEVQKVPGWNEQVKILFDEDRDITDLRVLLLGSSSLYLRQGLGDSLAGRFEQLSAPHWSYAECRKEFGWDVRRFLRFGGYPGAARFSGEPERWRDYVLNGIIEPVLSRDILGMTRVDKPALLRQTFELAVHHPAQIISLQNLLGQLQDCGNAVTIKHYLELLEGAFLIACLPKYTGSAIQARASSPKIIVMNSALAQAYREPATADDPVWFGRIVENAVGAALFQMPNAKLWYWREGHDEVDFVVKTGGKTYALEIKSGRVKGTTRGLMKFAERHPGTICLTWDIARCERFLREGGMEG